MDWLWELFVSLFVLTTAIGRVFDLRSLWRLEDRLHDLEDGCYRCNELRNSLDKGERAGDSTAVNPGGTD